MKFRVGVTIKTNTQLKHFLCVLFCFSAVFVSKQYLFTVVVFFLKLLQGTLVFVDSGASCGQIRYEQQHQVM